MQITDIKPFPVWVGTRNQMLVKVETDEGIYGWGESGLSSREIAVKGMVEHYREFLIGRDPMQRGALWQEMYRSQYFEGGRTMTAAISPATSAFRRSWTAAGSTGSESSPCRISVFTPEVSAISPQPTAKRPDSRTNTLSPRDKVLLIAIPKRHDRSRP